MQQGLCHIAQCQMPAISFEPSKKIHTTSMTHSFAYLQILSIGRLHANTYGNHIHGSNTGRIFK